MAKRGINAFVNYEADGIGNGGGFAKLKHVISVSVNDEKTTTDTQTRESPNWVLHIALARNPTVDIELLWKETEASQQALRDAYYDDAKIIGLQFLDEEDGEGLQADWIVKKFAREESKDGAITLSVSVELADSDTAPSYVGT